MSGSILFSVYLNERLSARGLDKLDLGRELGYRTLVPVSRWCRGEVLPPSSNLPAIAQVLNADPVEVSVVWLISKCPELEDVLFREVLEPRGSKVLRMI